MVINVLSYFEEKGGTRKWNRAMSGVQGDKQINKIVTLNGIRDLRARSHPTKLPTCEKEIKKTLRISPPYPVPLSS